MKMSVVQEHTTATLMLFVLILMDHLLVHVMMGTAALGHHAQVMDIKCQHETDTTPFVPEHQHQDAPTRIK